MLLDIGLKCDEVYTTQWRESKYTLIHLEHKIRSTALNKAMQSLHDSHNIIGSHITGYDMFSSNSGKRNEHIETHPGFKHMIEVLNKNIENLAVWLTNGSLTTNRKGLLWKYIQSTDPTEKTRCQLLEQVQKWTPIIKEHAELKSINQTLQVALNAETARSEMFFLQLVEQKKENNDLKLRILELGASQRLPEN